MNFISSCEDSLLGLQFYFLVRTDPNGAISKQDLFFDEPAELAPDNMKFPIPWKSKG